MILAYDYSIYRTMKGSIDDLVIYTKVAELLSFAMAAAELNVPTSFVSRRISNLEANLGIKLLNRTTRRVSLTGEGKLLFDEIAPKIDGTQRAVKELLSLKGRPQGTLKISTPVDLGKFLLKTCVPGFLEQYPQISLHWDFSTEKKDLNQSGIDLWIGVGKPKTESLIIRKLTETRLCAFKSPKLQMNTKKMGIEEISEIPWILFTDDVLGNSKRTLHCQFKDQNLLLSLKNIRSRANNLEAIKTFIEQGLGVGLLPEYMFVDDIKAKKIEKVFNLFNWDDPKEIILAYPENRYVSPKLRVFIDWITKHFTI